jgi:hypothetical protein
MRDYDVPTARRRQQEALDRVRAVVKEGGNDGDLREAMTEWACWRELMARLQDDNKGRETGR